MTIFRRESAEQEVKERRRRSGELAEVVGRATGDADMRHAAAQPVGGYLRMCRRGGRKISGADRARRRNPSLVGRRSHTPHQRFVETDNSGDAVPAEISAQRERAQHGSFTRMIANLTVPPVSDSGQNNTIGLHRGGASGRASTHRSAAPFRRAGSMD